LGTSSLIPLETSTHNILPQAVDFSLRKKDLNIMVSTIIQTDGPNIHQPKLGLLPGFITHEGEYTIYLLL